MKKTLLTIGCFLACTFSIRAQVLFGITGGTLSKFDTRNNILTTIKSFGITPSGNLLQATDGKIYGTTIYGGSNYAGIIFSLDAASGNFVKLMDLDRISGASPHGGLIQASNGLLYGMTHSGGSSDAGVIFSFDPASSTYTNLKDFDGTSGRWPFGSLMQASDGKLYGMTYAGGGNNGGVIFSYDPASSTYTKLKDISGIDFTYGAEPLGSLIQASDGKLYGTTFHGGGYNTGAGVIFSYDPISSKYTKLKDFDGTNGSNPVGSLMQTSDGKLYGMTFLGGSSNNGVIFSYDPISSNYTKLKDFDVIIAGYPFIGPAFIEVNSSYVHLKSPTDKATYRAPGQIPLIAEAFIPDATIKSVSFYNRSTLIFNETTAPYSRTWHNVPVGDYTITAVATDAKGVKITSAPAQVHVVADKPPVVSLTSPSDDASFAAPGTILLTADASDPDGKIRSVSFYNGSTLIFNETTAPYSRTWHNVPLGDYTITAVATDDGGNRTTSSPIVVRVVPNKPPVVSITYPNNDGTFSAPGSIPLLADATDPDGKIKSVDFYNGSTLIFTESYFPYSRTWTKVPLGDYTITAVATDNMGLKTTSAPVRVHLTGANKPPVVKITSPADTSAYQFRAGDDLVFDVTADASDADGTVQKVVIYGYGPDLWPGQSSHTFPYWADFIGYSTGTYNFYAVATDNNGLETTSDTIAVRLGGYFPDTDSDGYGAGSVVDPGLLVFTRPAGYVEIPGDCDDGNPNIHPDANEPCNGPDLNCDGSACCDGVSFETVDGRVVCSACGIIDAKHVACTPCGGIAFEDEQCTACGIIWNDQQCTPCGIISKYDVCDTTTLTIRKSSPTAGKDISTTASLKLAPNPANNILNIHTTGLENARQVSLSVISPLGLTVQTKQIAGSVGTFQLDVSHLAKGVYTIKLMSDKKVIYKQFVKL